MTTTPTSPWLRVKSALADSQRRPYANYMLIVSVVLLLVTIGLVMVASVTMAMAASASPDKVPTVWGDAVRQVIVVGLGLASMWLAMRLRPQTVRRLSNALVGVTFVLLTLVLIPGLGSGLDEVGSRSWLNLGPISFQPSEVARVAIAVWGANHLADRKPTIPRWNSHYGVFFGVAGAMALLILLERDFGMTVSFLFVVTALLVFAGMSLRVLGGLFLAALVPLVILIAIEPYRVSRITTYVQTLMGQFTNPQGESFQVYQGFLSLADGSLFGVGVGQSRAKWNYLPEAQNDFIFAIIGEELGWFGASVVVCLFGLLGYAGIRTAIRASNQFQSLLAATLTAAVVGQAFINMGYVVGLLPVTGIQLPMISAGGTSAVITLGAMGLLANCARHEPEAMSAMANYGRPTFDSVLRLPEPSVEGLDRQSASRPRPRGQQGAGRRPAPVRRRPPGR